MKKHLNIIESFLFYLVWIYPDNKATKEKPNFKKLSKKEYNFNYALKIQYMSKLKGGVKFDFYDKRILEIGSGHGGISTFLAINGAKEVIGIDINDDSLDAANDFKNFICDRLNISKLNLSFFNSDASKMPFDSESIDLILADNVFEHFIDYEGVLKECHRVLSKNGRLVIPIFSSIYSKYAYHVKYGMKLPWIQWFFSDKTIINVLKRRADLNPKIYDAYPGLRRNPVKISEIRKHNDLNDISYKKFKVAAYKYGFNIESFYTLSSGKTKILTKIIRRIPILNKSIIADIFSTGASAVLIKN